MESESFAKLQQRIAQFHQAEIQPVAGVGPQRPAHATIAQLLDGATEAQIGAQVRELRARRGFANHVRYNLRILESLVAQQADYENISVASRTRYELDEAAVALLTAFTDDDGNATATWTTWVDRLLDELLIDHPMVPSDEWERGLLAPEPPQLRAPNGAIASSWSDAIPLEASIVAIFRQKLLFLASEARLDGECQEG